MLENSNFNKTADNKKVSLFKLSNKNGLVVQISNFGARIVSICIPDKYGVIEDIILGYDNIEDYFADSLYFGATIGRYANRIKNGKFKLEGKSYTLNINNGRNALHGGNKGFDKAVWDAKQNNNILKLSYLSKDMEEGYPGNLNVSAVFELTDNNELKIDYKAITDKSTIINLACHPYFNLKGHNKGSILDHKLTINADYITEVDSNLTPTGKLISVKDTPFDFRACATIESSINKTHEQLVHANGYDHNWVLNKFKMGELSFAAKLEEQTTGRTLEISTTEPGMQLFSTNCLQNGLKGKHGSTYKYRSGIAIEAQHFPDSPNHPSFPPTLLRPNEVYMQTTIFKFSVLNY